MNIRPAAASDQEPRVTVEQTDSGCRVHGTFDAPVARDTAWAVLTDYDHIGRFVRSVRASRVERREADRLLLRQDAVGGWFLFRRRVQVLLDVREEPGRRVAFRDVLGKDFRDYVGEWRIAADSTGLHVSYQLQAEPRMPIPGSVCRGVLRGTARTLLAEVRAEMLRRMADAAPDSTRR